MSKTVSALQVLVFRLEDKRYCIDIAHIDEIVDRHELTKLPDSKPHVEGVMDLRGTTTTIVNPKTVLGLSGSGTGNRVIVFETEDERSIGWVIDEVNQVISLDDVEVDESVESQSVHGVIRQDGEFIIWVKPSAINV
ncbi:chemotaxis protein CheW [Haladaptatus sp. T7]|uniref:chemotaxis protein CheW n=1 Tax=Haladaptatus sp. T7 TaxID=2029368 RepID=UPI0021A2582C|nr:chemotaxis protein CheW [Haladaptatus sp. T7]GKZ12513.1 chemotaxis protein CheW [Haladaptatus sp. T7]